MIAMSEGINSMDWAIQQPILQSQVNKTNFLDIAVVFPDGTARYSGGTTNQLGDRDYVKKALKGEKNVSDLIVSRVTNEIVLMYAVPIEREGKVVGALIGRRNGVALNDIISDTGFGESGYAYMINSQGTLVAHPEEDRVLNQWNPIEEAKNDKALESLALEFEKILQDRSGVSSYSFQGNDLYNAFAPIEETDWIVVVTANKNEVLSSIPVLQRDIIITNIIILLVSIALVYLIGNSIVNPIIKTVRHSEKIASLDLTQDIAEKHLKKKDEIGKLAAAMQTITNSLRQIIGEINSSSEQVSAASEELTASTQQSATAAEEVSKTVEEIAISASHQAQNIEQGSTKAVLLGMTIEKDQKNLDNLNAASNKVNEVVEEGLIEIDNLLRITEESNNAAK
jgi:methyl-accepting chemotaxis protein